MHAERPGFLIKRANEIVAWLEELERVRSAVPPDLRIIVDVQGRAAIEIDIVRGSSFSTTMILTAGHAEARLRDELLALFSD